jgi:SAM-dependent methyltransferase
MATTERDPYVDPELYDVVYSWYTSDIPYYVDAAKRAQGPVLEIACGTGRILLPTLQAGVDIEGIDLEPAMLRRLEDKARALGLTPRVKVADMRDFTMSRRYRLITIPFRAFLHLHATDDQIRSLRCIREHLEPGGALLLNFFFPSVDYITAHHDQRKLEREFPHPETGLSVAFYDTPHYDRVNQTATVEREVIESDPRGYAGQTHRYSFTLRMVYRYEMELLLRAAGFTRYQVTRPDGAPHEKDNEEMMWTAWKD